MKVLIIGQADRAVELKACLPMMHEVTVQNSATSIEGFEVVFDLNADENDYRIPYKLLDQLLIVSAVKKTLSAISGTINNYHNMAGMNLLPGMINRGLKEVSFLQNKPLKSFIDFATATGWKYSAVNDSAGMVTPRVLSMIINEAAYTLQEGTASKEDIDKGMILGTNYPTGPLAWCDQLGIYHVINVLEALHAQTGNERYKVCPLLIEKNEKKEKFY